MIRAPDESALVGGILSSPGTVGELPALEGHAQTGGQEARARSFHSPVLDIWPYAFEHQLSWYRASAEPCVRDRPGLRPVHALRRKIDEFRWPAAPHSGSQ